MTRQDNSNILEFVQKNKSISLEEVCSYFNICLDEIESAMFELEKENKIRIENSTCSGNCGSCGGCDSQNASIEPISLSSIIVAV